MRPLLLAVLVSLLAAPLAVAQTTGPSGPTGPTVSNPSPPTATTDPATDIGLNAATVRGRVDPNGAQTTVRFEYGTSSSYGLATATQTLPAGSSTVDVQARLDKLTSATTYHYRVVATNAAGVTRGSDRTFKTASTPGRPTVASEPARDIAVDAATLSARVDPNRQATTYVFEYGTSTRYGKSTPGGDAGAGDNGVRVQARVGGLLANTTYHFRLRATNASGATLGADRSFRTGKQPLGLTATASPSIVRYTRTATITGTVTGSDRNGVPITLERRNFPYTAGFAPFGNQQLTDATGVVRFLVPPFTLASQFRLVAPGRGGLTSNIVTTQVRALVRMRVRRLAHGRLRLAGTVAPGSAAGLVSIQRRGATGRYAVVRRVVLRGGPGVARFSVVLRARARPTTYRAATRLTGGTLVDARSPIIRVRGRNS